MVQPPDTVGFGPRAGARLIDLVVAQAAGLVGGVFGGVVLFVLESTGLARAGWAQRLDHSFALNLLSGAVSSLVGASVATVLCGASVGKWILGLRVVRTSGARVGLGPSVIRELAYYIDSLFFGLIAKGQMDGSPYHQRLGDQWAGTAVVRAKTLPASVAPSTTQLVLGVGLGFAVESLVLGAFMVLGAR